MPRRGIGSSLSIMLQFLTRFSALFFGVQRAVLYGLPGQSSSSRRPEQSVKIYFELLLIRLWRYLICGKLASLRWMNSV